MKQVQTDSGKYVIYLYPSSAWITPIIGSYVRRENTLILHKNTLVFLKFDESMRRMRVQDTYFLFIFQREHKKIKIIVHIFT